MKLQAASGPATQKIQFAASASNVTLEVVKGDATPVLKTDKGDIFGAHAIVRYIARSNGDPARLFGSNDIEAAQVESWLAFSTSEVEGPLSGWIDGNKAASGDVRKALSSLDAYLRPRTFLVGERLTAADAVLAISLLPGYQSVIDAKTRKPFKNLLRWFKTVVNNATVAGATREVVLSGESTPCNQGNVPAAAPVSEKKEEEAGDDEFDCFGDEDEDDLARQEEIQRIADEAKKAKEAKGKVLIEKSVIVLDVKPWDSETDLKELEVKIRGIEMEGLEWKGSEFKEIAFGVQKIVIMCHIVDKLVSVDDLQEKIQEFEDEVQSTDIVSFSKL